MADILKAMLAKQKKKKGKEEMIEEGENNAEDEDPVEEDREDDEEKPEEDTGFKYASEEMTKMLGDMDNSEPTETEFTEVELVVDGKPLRGSALVDFVIENEKTIRSMDE